MGRERSREMQRDIKGHIKKWDITDMIGHECDCMLERNKNIVGLKKVDGEK